MKDNKSEKPILDDRDILVNQAEIAKRRRINAMTFGSFALGNFPINPDTQHILKTL